MPDREAVVNRTGVLLAVNGGPAAAAASAPSAALAARLGGEVVVLEVGSPAAAAEGRELVTRVAAEIARTGCRARGEFRESGPDAAEAIAAAAVDLGCEVAVVASRAPSELGGLLHGSVAHRLLGHSPCPILVVPLHPHGVPIKGALLDRVVLAVDVSLESEHAAALLPRLLSAGARLKVVHVRPKETLIATAVGAFMGGVGEGSWPLESETEAGALVVSYSAGLRSLGFKTTDEVLSGTRSSIADRIVKTARAFRAGLIVMGSRGLSDMEGLRHGSVAHGVIAATHCPVLVTR